MAFRSPMFVSAAFMILWKCASISGSCVQKNSSKCLNALDVSFRCDARSHDELVFGRFILIEWDKESDTDASSMPSARLRVTIR